MKDPAFLFYPKDFLEGTSEMTYEEMGIYIKLLSHQWLRGDLPSDKDRLSRLLKIPLKDLEGYPYVFEKFDINGESMTNERLEDERGRRQKFKESASMAGVKGQFLKKQKSILKVQQYKKLEELVNSLSLNDIRDKGTLKGMLKGCLSNIANANGDVNKGNVVTRAKVIYDEFLTHKDVTEVYRNFVAFLFGNNITQTPLKNVLALNQQISPTSFNALLEKYPKEKIKEVIESMASKDLDKYKIKSFVLTVHKWCEK